MRPCPGIRSSPKHIPDLATLWREIANPRVRHTGTVGGNIMSRQPHYDAMPALMALGATATIADPGDRRADRRT